MKRQSKYILAVYATFSIELLFNIVTMWFCEDILCWNQITTFDDLESKLKILAMVFIPVGVIKGLFDEILDKERNDLLILFCYLIVTLILCFFYGSIFTLVDVGSKILGLHNIISYALCITVLIFISMTIWGFLTKRKDYHHPILNNIFIGSFIISIFNMFWGWSWLNIIIDIVDLVVVSLFIYLDTIEIKQHSKELMQVNKKREFLNIIKDATDIYVEFMFIWLDLVDLMTEAVDDSN